MTPYQRRLFLFLSVATFFEGYDFMALTQLLPTLMREFDFAEAGAGALVGFINLGTVLAAFLISRADRWGRKRVLTVTILGYTLCTLASGMATDIYLFAIAQLLARIFLLAEWAVSMVIAAEEFPAERRATVIGVVQASASLGAVICAGAVPFLLETPLGWRTVYFLGVLPLVMIAYARRGLRETRRFEEARLEEAGSFFGIWSSEYRGRMLALAAIWFFAYIAAQNAVGFWKAFAVNEVGFTEKRAGLAISIAALAAMPMIFYIGRVVDRIGRRRSAALVFVAASLGTAGCYLFRDFAGLTVSLAVGIFAASGFLPILNSYTAELFPTRLRGDAFAWSNNILGRVSYVASPFAVGALAESFGGFGPVVAATALFPLVSLALVYLLLPETRSLELEETAAL